MATVFEWDRETLAGCADLAPQPELMNLIESVCEGEATQRLIAMRAAVASGDDRSAAREEAAAAALEQVPHLIRALAGKHHTERQTQKG